MFYQCHRAPVMIEIFLKKSEHKKIYNYVRSLTQFNQTYWLQMLSLTINSAFISKLPSSPEGRIYSNYLTVLILPGILATKNPMPLPVNNHG